MRPRNCETSLHLLLITMGTWPGVAYGAAAASHSNHGYDLPTNLCTERYEIATTSIIRRTTELFRALEKSTNTQTMIKVFDKERSFVREARILDKLAKKIAKRTESALNHFVRLLDKCLYDDKQALVFEFFDKILEDQITIDLEVNAPVDDGLAASSPKRPRLNPHDNPAPANNFKQYAYQILQAVGTLHEWGIFHLDLKPTNIGLTHDDTIKLFDFGDSCTNFRRSVVGTLGYMAPEMSIGLGRTVQRYDKVSKMDIWSVGCTIFKIYTGKLLFDGIVEFVMCATSSKPCSDSITEHEDVMVSTISPVMARQCKFYAGYFYIKWSYGSHNLAKYKTEEARAKQECPLIFSEDCADKLKDKMKVYRHTYLAGDEYSVEDDDTEVHHTMEQLKSNQSQKATRLDPSNTEPQDLIDLLGGLLMFDFDDRIAAEEALTRYAIFNEFHKQTSEKRI